MPDRLNVFEPYESLPPHHENQLTRALLVVLRCCPILHQAWLSLIPEPDPARKRKLQELERPGFDTQRAHILDGEDQPPTNEPITGFSVLCAADPGAGAGAVRPSNRGQVLDGIIRYGNDLVVVLESKLDGPADDRQAHDINLHGQPVAFEGGVRTILWRDVLAIVTDFADEKRGLISGAERLIVTDFLDFVGRNFPRLGPFSTLQRCQREPSRIDRRLRVILSNVLRGEGASLPGTHLTVTAAYLTYKDEEVRLDMYPADTLQQARAFYARPDAPTRVLAMEEHGWRVFPNFHFGYMATGLVDTKTDRSSAEYMEYWQGHIGMTGQVNRADWERYWGLLVNERIARPTDREAFDRAFTNTTRRESASPRPGIRCSFVWPIVEAERLDARDQLVVAVKERINEVLVALGEPLLD